MKKLKLIIILSIVFTLLLTQAGAVFAAPSAQEGFIEGTVTEVSCETNLETGDSTYFVTVEVSEGIFETVQVDQTTAEGLGIVTAETVCNSDGTVEGAVLDVVVSIDPATVIPEEEVPQHPVGAALSMFFTDITDYETIMAAHEDGTGFGLLAQALWLTKKMEGDSDTFMAIVDAKKTKDFSAFVMEDGSTPQNWGQFKKAALNGDKKGNLGVVMSNKDNNGNGQDKDKTNNGNGQDKDKTNNGNGQDNKKDK
ncbi:MAG TPA: hypothetical protein VJ972_10365 [Anaerolineales bacterium]|nr:hypothetical protein [Anaerolineales bacterium]